MDVTSGLGFFSTLLSLAAINHDSDKIDDIDMFFSDFKTGFATTGWWDNHRKISRHHLNSTDGIPEGVNLIDVLEMITDCVMAGMARSGKVYAITLSQETLQKAFENTVKLLLSEVEVDKEATNNRP